MHEDDEWRLRVDLAACYRLVALNGWDDLLATHISAKIGRTGHFLINPYGMTFEEITASSLLKIDLDGTLVTPSRAGDYQANPAGFTIHSAVHQVRQDAGCVIHLHTDHGVAVSILEDGLLPLCQTALLAATDLAYHDFEGVAEDLDERTRIQRDLGAANHLILRNHGTLAVGRSIPEAFFRIYNLERACAIQVKALSMQRPLRRVSQPAIDRMRAITTPDRIGGYADLAWPALRRRLDRDMPGYDQ